MKLLDNMVISFYLFFKDSIYLFIFREREQEREGEKHRCERETLIGCLSRMPRLGTEPITQACAQQRIEPATFLYAGQCSNQLGHSGQGLFLSFEEPLILFSIEATPLYIPTNNAQGSLPSTSSPRRVIFCVLFL